MTSSPPTQKRQGRALFAPPATVAGAHAASVSVVGSKQLYAEHFTVQLWNFSLPSTSSRYATTFGVRLNDILYGKHWPDAPHDVTPEEEALLMRQYVLLGLMHRITLNPFLEAARRSLAAGKDSTAAPDWETVDREWGDVLYGELRLPFGLDAARGHDALFPSQ